MPNIDLSILNQRQTPAFYADILANRPAAGFIGRIFVSTNTFEFYRDNGTTWNLIGGPGAGTVTGTGAAGQVTYWNGASTVTGDNGLFYDAVNDRLGIGTITPGAAIDAHSSASIIGQLNQTTATNNSLLAFQNSGAGLWRLGNFYNAAANDFGIFDVVGAIQPLTIKRFTGQTLIGAATGSGKLVVSSASSDNGIQIVGTSAPSLRIDNAEIGPTKRVGLGIATALNNFIQGAVDRDFCIFNGSTTAASPILFGVYDTGLSNVQEAARISAARNFLIGTSTDAGFKADINGTARIQGNLTLSAQVNAPANYQTNMTGGNIAYFVRQNIIATNDNILQLQPSSTGGASVIEGLFAAALGLTTNLSTAPIIFAPNRTERARIFSATGNFAINTTTDGGFKLDVNGTARVQTNLSVGSGYTPNFQSGETINTNGRIRAEGGITFRAASSGDVLGPGIYANGGSGQAGLNFFCGGSSVGLMNLIGNTTGNLLQIGTTQFTNVATGNSTQLNIVPTYNPNVPTTVTYRGIYYSASITAPGNFNGAHIGIQIENGDSLFGTSNGSVGVGATSTINASSILQVTSTTKGFLPPRMTSAQKTAIATPATGLVVYDTTLNKLAVYTGAAWETVTSV